ncbi:hypothetical protein [Bacillus sp. B1-b2]|uniref:hypothetical protein n=1 Tax=Bacillus sp. B1-b2 TaxID=2653201 RepID=UPI001262A7F0|nr:hypothetical protein [Bacillus sp. B1-b2]KAB7665183.1 hypothetical protein F9279_21280 [Bacillus sp. B1-b2]
MDQSPNIIKKGGGGKRERGSKPEYRQKRQKRKERIPIPTHARTRTEIFHHLYEKSTKVGYEKNGVPV